MNTMNLPHGVLSWLPVAFDHPSVLPGGVVFVPLAILAIIHYQRRRNTICALPGRQTPRIAFGRYWGSICFFWVFVGCLIIALAGPRWGRRPVIEFHRGVDVVFALDVSRSMEVTDLPDGRSRRATAFALAADVAAASRDIRLGAALGKGGGVLAVPLTYDTTGMLTFLEGLEHASALTGRGTNLESLIDAAASAFQDSVPARRLILLFSDGEHLTGSLPAALDRAADRDIRITTVALGTLEGGPVPPDSFRPDTPPDGTDKADEGTDTAPPVISRLHTDTLQSIAERTGGSSLSGNAPGAVETLLDHIQAMAPETGAQGYQPEQEDQRQVFVLLALGALSISWLLQKRRRRTPAS